MDNMNDVTTSCDSEVTVQLISVSKDNYFEIVLDVVSVNSSKSLVYKNV